MKQVDITKFDQRKRLINLLYYCLDLATREFKFIEESWVEALADEAREGKVRQDDSIDNDEWDFDNMLESEHLEELLEEHRWNIKRLKDAVISAYQEDFQF